MIVKSLSAMCTPGKPALRHLTPYDVLEPLCKGTTKLFKPLSFLGNEKISLRYFEDDKSLKKFDVQAYLERRDGSMGPASFELSDRFFLRIPEKKRTGHGRWICAATDFTALVINATWGHARVVFVDDDTRTVYEYLISRFMKQSLNARKIANFKMNKVVPDPPKDFKDFLDHPQRPLLPHQRVAAFVQMNMEGFAEFMEQSTGKTPIIIARMCNEARQKRDFINNGAESKSGRMYRMIVTCPRNVRSNWQREIGKFATTPGKVVVLRGSKLDRVKQLVEATKTEGDNEWAAVICSYESIANTWDAIQMIPWDLGVADESHFIKSHYAKRTAKMLELREICGCRAALTGTPIANTVTDLYTQLEWLGEGMSGFSTVKSFREYYSKYTNEANPNERRLIGYKNMPILQERLARVSIMFTKKEVNPDLPDKMYDVIEVQMQPKQREYYIMLMKELAVEIEADLERSKNSHITVNNILTKLLRLNQITSGYIVADRQYDLESGDLLNEDRISFFDPNPKMDQLMEILKAKGDKDKTIVWSCWVPVIKKIEELCKAEDIKVATYYGGTKDKARDEIERAFNEDPELKVLNGNPAAGGVGLNLPGYIPDWEGTSKDHGCNANHTIFYACDWSMLKRSQAEDRNHGNFRCRVPIRISDLCCPQTIDEEIRARVLDKKISAMKIQDLRAVMNHILHSVPDIDQ